MVEGKKAVLDGRADIAVFGPAPALRSDHSIGSGQPPTTRLCGLFLKPKQSCSGLEHGRKKVEGD